jgi:hypothetical protein
VTIDDADLVRLERDVADALARADASALHVLGYGEISLVLGWPAATPVWACKRLPPMPTTAAVDAYEQTLHRYLAELARRGVEVVETDVRRVGTTVYCVQPVLPPGSLAVDVVGADAHRAPQVLRSIVDTVFTATDERVGFDAQLSNWAVDDHGRLRYFDVTTPLLRAADGTEELDTELFLASLPAALRAAVRRFVLPDILDRYHRPRTVVLDLAANLYKERLDRWIPTVLDAAGDRVDPPITADEVRRDYRSDARTWSLLQALRRADRTWQRRVRRRTYPVLLPSRIDR